MPIQLAHRLTQALAERRKSGALPWLRPDGKAQVTVVYENGQPVRVSTVVVSTQHAETVSNDELRSSIISEVIERAIPPELLAGDVTYHINPTGRFVVGGPQGDAGLTGRKIIVDTYGGAARHGGGAFSGKDPSKVDRSAAYAARWVAKNVVAAGLAKRCEVQLAYAIGVVEPVSIMVDTFNSCTVPEKAIRHAIREVFDLSPRAIINALGLRSPIYRRTASGGHFGRSPVTEKSGSASLTFFSWERTDRVDDLRNAAESSRA
jgi:S-adenosylmethionine synthetase